MNHRDPTRLWTLLLNYEDHFASSSQKAIVKYLEKALALFLIV